MAQRSSVRERLFSQLVSTDPPTSLDRLDRPLVGPCLIWTGTHIKGGYGRTTLPGHKRVLVHRLMYELFVGPIEDQLDHLCRVRDCASPAHLEPVTSAENSRRGNNGINYRDRTHCPQGHPYDEANTHYSNTNGQRRRHCRTCLRERTRRYRAEGRF